MTAPVVTKSPPPQLFTLAVDTWTQPYWDAAREHHLTACCCAACGTFRMPPTPFCPRCRSQQTRWPTLSGRGTIYSYTIVERAIVPEMEAHLPYAPAVIELEGAGGARLVSNVVGARIEDLKVGAPVNAIWEDRPDGVSIVRFSLDAAPR
jgi:uncharacterized OB-fold protein